MKVLIAIGWLLAALDGIFMMVALVTRDMGDDAAGRGVGTSLGLIGLGIVAVAAIVIHFSARANSWAGILFATGLLALPLVFLFGTAATSALQELNYRISTGKTGRYRDARQRELAASIRAGDLDGIRRVLALKPNLEGRDPIGYDLLSYAVALVRQQKGSVDAVRLLLEAGMDPNLSRNPNDTGLLEGLVYTTSPGDKNVFELLLEHGADPNKLGEQNGRPLLVEADDPDVEKLLVEHGADVNWRGPGQTPLIQFILTSRWDNAVYLIQHGADVTLAAGDGTSPSSALDSLRQADGSLPEGALRVQAAIAAADIRNRRQ
jgi:hypothetical protein